MKSTLCSILLGCSFLFIQTGFIQSSALKQPEYTFKIIPSLNNTWGYDIYVNNKLKIHQPNIPGNSGTTGFKTRKSAIKVAELVIKKMKAGEMPPIVTKGELKNLRV